jgi:hypothetical protein
MEPEDFDFEEFMENSNRDFEMKLEAYREKMMTIAIEANYANIEKNGIGEWHLRHMSHTDLNDLIRTFQIMMDYYEADEAYEQCAVILKEKHKIERVMTIKRDI